MRQAFNGYCTTLRPIQTIGSLTAVFAILPGSGSAFLGVPRYQRAIVSPAENLLVSEKRSKERYRCHDNDDVYLNPEMGVLVLVYFVALEDVECTYSNHILFTT